MKTTKPAVILLALVLLTAAAVQSAEKPAKKPISNTRTASCLVKVTSDPAVLPLNEFAVADLLYSSGIAGKAAREVLDISPDIASKLFWCEEIYSIDTDPYGGIGIPSGSSPRRLPTTTARTTTTPTAYRSRTSAEVTRFRRTPTTTATTRIPAFPGGAVSGLDDYYLKPKPTSGRSTRRTTTKSTASTTEQTILFHLRVDFSEAVTDEDIKPAAEEFMNALIENLRSALRGAFDEYRSKLNEKLNLAGEEARRAEMDLVQMQAKLREISGSRDLSRNMILSDIREMRQQLQSTKMTGASERTIYEATARQIAEEQARRKKLVEDDPITRELLSLTDAHEKRLKDTQKFYDAGNASFATVYDLKEKIIRSRIELAKRREQIINPTGSIEISSLTNELASLATNLALAEQEIRSLEEQLSESDGLLAKADRYELLSLKTDIAKQNLEETLLWRARLGRNIRSIQPPDVTVIGAE